MHRYEITVALPNGDWVWRRAECADFHEVCTTALDFAATAGGRVHHVERLPPVAKPATTVIYGRRA
jgi:hypothetical protein